mgnify:FL=1
MYAIRNKRTKKWLYGTDFREYPYKQRISNEQAMLFESKEDAEYQFRRRDCKEGQYEIVKVKLIIDEI